MRFLQIHFLVALSFLVILFSNCGSPNDPIFNSIFPGTNRIEAPVEDGSTEEFVEESNNIDTPFSDISTGTSGSSENPGIPIVPGTSGSFIDDPVDIPVTIAKIPEVIHPWFMDIQIEDHGLWIEGMNDSIPSTSPDYESFLIIQNLTTGLETRIDVRVGGYFPRTFISMTDSSDHLLFMPYKREEMGLRLLLVINHALIWYLLDPQQEFYRGEYLSMDDVVSPASQPVEIPIIERHPLHPDSNPDEVLIVDIPNTMERIDRNQIPGKPDREFGIIRSFH